MRISKAFLFPFIALLAGLVWYSFFRNTPPPVLKTTTVQRGDVEQRVSATGDITAISLVDVGAQVTGQIKRFNVILGQQVKKGELIAEIDNATQLNELNTAQARLKSYQAQLASKQVSFNIAKKNHERELRLWKKRSTSQKEMEASTDALAAAKAAIIELESSIEQAKISLATAKTNLSYTRIVAPIDGVIVSTAIEEGQTVNSVQSSPTLVQIADLSKMLIRMQVAEGDITKITPGMKVRVTTLANPDQPRITTISSIDPGLTSMSQGRYTSKTDLSTTAIYYYARAEIDNTDGQLRIGMTTENSILIHHVHQVILVPTATLQDDAKGNKFVFIAGENGPEKRQVATGLMGDMHTEILSGLTEGEKVITSQLPEDLNPAKVSMKQTEEQ